MPSRPLGCCGGCRGGISQWPLLRTDPLQPSKLSPQPLSYHVWPGKCQRGILWQGPTTVAGSQLQHHSVESCPVGGGWGSRGRTERRRQASYLIRIKASDTSLTPYKLHYGLKSKLSNKVKPNCILFFFNCITDDLLLYFFF